MNTLTSPQKLISALFKCAGALDIKLNRRLRKLRPPRVIGFLMLIVASLCFQTQSSIAAPSTNDSVRVANFTSFSDQALREFLAKTLKPELKELIARNKLALFALTAAFGGKKACYGYVGLTEAPPQGRHARHPSVDNSSFRVIGGDTEWNASDCESDALTQAAVAFDKRPMEELLNEIEVTKSVGQIRERKQPNPERASVITYGGLKANTSAEIVNNYDFGKAFDYRHVSTVVASDAIQFKDGTFMCVAFAGISSRPPDDRNSRWPGSIKGFVRLQTGGDASGCQQFAAEQAVNSLLKSPWTPEGLLKNFAATKEDGISLPDPVKVAKAKALIDRSSQPVQVAATTRSTNRVTCTNNCVNGSCLRRFADGRTERWQAPRKFNPFENNWEWDTTTNACGL